MNAHSVLVVFTRMQRSLELCFFSGQKIIRPFEIQSHRVTVFNAREMKQRTTVRNETDERTNARSFHNYHQRRPRPIWLTWSTTSPSSSHEHSISSMQTTCWHARSSRLLATIPKSAHSSKVPTHFAYLCATQECFIKRGDAFLQMLTPDSSPSIRN
jgi:hypothetical protein